MTTNEVNRIVSEDYADFVIENTGVQDFIRNFPDATVVQINYLVSLVNIPVQYITNQSIQQLGYGAFPAVGTIVSQASLEASEIFRLRSVPNLNLHGQGVLLGFFDTGIDYTNPVFRNADGTTRIAAIWDQTIQSGNPPEGYLYGTEYTREQINQALQSDNPLDIVPTKDENGHGTMVAGIAGGNEVPESNFYGIATQAEFVIIKGKPAKKYLKEFLCIPEDAIAFQENDLSFGLEYMMNVSTRLTRPLAICMTTNSSESAHDGRGTLNNYQALIASTPGIAFIVAAGNEGNSGRHYSGMTDEVSRTDTVEISVGENASNFAMQLWGKRPNLYFVDITSPSGEFVTGTAPNTDTFQEARFIKDKTVIYVDYQLIEAQTGNQLIEFRFKDPAPGIWSLKVHELGDLRLGFNIWMPVEGFISDNIHFIHSDPYVTVLAIGNIPVALTVTAYNVDDDSLYLDASRGYSSTDVVTPQIAAPGVNVIGPTPQHTFTEFTGTSVAAAHTTGVAALLLEWGIIKGNIPGMSTLEMRFFMENGARRDINIVYPNRDWGYGILDVYNMFSTLTGRG